VETLSDFFVIVSGVVSGGRKEVEQKAIAFPHYFGRSEIFVQNWMLKRASKTNHGYWILHIGHLAFNAVRHSAKTFLVWF